MKALSVPGRPEIPVRVGTTCKATLPVPAASVTEPVAAVLGTTSCICVPAALTADGVTVPVPALPALSRVGKTTPVDAVNPVPTRVIVWATSAEATAGLAGVPLSATAVIAVSAGVGGAGVAAAEATKTTPSVEATRS